jgi:two-component system NtrC family response regulator
MNRKRILVADDEEVIRMLIRLVLGTDYEIVEVADGEEAWQKLVDANFQFDLVIVDWKMPRLGGEELLARIQKHNVSMPVLVLTGNIQAPKLSQPHVRVATKPFDNSQLAKTVRELVTK